MNLDNIIDRYFYDFSITPDFVQGPVDDMRLSMGLFYTTLDREIKRREVLLNNLPGGSLYENIKFYVTKRLELLGLYIKRLFKKY